jgi:hypothetical protein
MSPRISTESVIDPIQAERSPGALGWRRRCSKARHIAPNIEITVCFMCLAQYIIHDSLTNRHMPSIRLTFPLLFKSIPRFPGRRELLLRPWGVRPCLLLQLE